eukprot:TRINITY_DN20797_c0_g1_i1.p1 TRINITY_DN20797_c0_g1~~TRINITY_DN20797_c0_g1_i1.p1  ORF type:complete len:338 (-),score=29.46 TRINITY_DN20797_c0_g1_i1:238-1251(-)
MKAHRHKQQLLRVELEHKHGIQFLQMSEKIHRQELQHRFRIYRANVRPTDFLEYVVLRELTDEVTTRDDIIDQENDERKRLTTMQRALSEMLRLEQCPNTTYNLFSQPSNSPYECQVTPTGHPCLRTKSSCHSHVLPDSSAILVLLSEPVTGYISTPALMEQANKQLSDIAPLFQPRYFLLPMSMYGEQRDGEAHRAPAILMSSKGHGWVPPNRGLEETWSVVFGLRLCGVCDDVVGLILSYIYAHVAPTQQQTTVAIVALFKHQTEILQLGALEGESYVDDEEGDVVEERFSCVRGGITRDTTILHTRSDRELLRAVLHPHPPLFEVRCFPGEEDF